MDIRFYTLDFSEMHILPATSKENGYVSMNCEIEFCGPGNFELVFYDAELEDFIKEHKEGVLIEWGNFQGYLTDYQIQEERKWAFGSHINALLHKYVIPLQTINGDLKVAASTIITQHTPFTFMNSTEEFGTIEYTTDKYQNIDAFFIDMLSKVNIGYRLYFENGIIYFKLIKPVVNPLVLSKNNRNVYEQQEDYSNKTVAYGGWYKKTKEDDGTEIDPEEWTYIYTDEKRGIYKQDIVLNSNSPSEALKELATYKAEFDVNCKTRNVEYETDYNIGDIIRYQTKSGTFNKQITKVSLWLEGSTYHQEPTLTEWEDTDV